MVARAVSTKWEALGQAGAKSQAGSGGDQRGARRCSGGLEGLQEGSSSLNWIKTTESKILFLVS